MGLIDNLHLNQLNTQNLRIAVDGVEPPPGRDFHLVDYGEIDEDFLATAGIDVVEGRGLDETDREDSEPVALVSQEFVRRFFPEGGAVGRIIRVNGEPTRVVGVTSDHKVRQLGEATRPFVHLSIHQAYSRNVTILARTSGDADRLAVEMMTEARRLDPQIMITDTKTLDRHLAIILLARELGAWVVGGFALLALLLATIGVYGVVSYAVARRVREVGIRLSLGAETGRLIRLLTGSGMKLAGTGALVGLAISAAVAQLLSRLLYGVPALDPVTFVGAPAVLGLVALLACWIPARRITRIDPVRALRAE